MRALILAAAASLAFWPLTGALARDLPAGGMTLEEIQAWLKGDGLLADIETGSDGTRNVHASADGSEFHIFGYDCKDARCGSLQFSAGFDTKGAFGPGPMNDWNRDNRWTRAYADKVNDPWLEYDVDLTPGGTYELLEDQLGIWRESIGRFRKQINQ